MLATTLDVPEKIAPVPTDPSVEYLPGGSGSTFGSFGGGYGPRILGRAIDDITKVFGPQLYEFMLLDAAVAGALFKLATGTLNGKVRLVPRVKMVPGRPVTPEQQRSEDITEDNRRNLDRLERPIEDVMREMFYALAFGNVLAEVVESPNRIDGKRALHCIAPKPWWAWQFGVDRCGNVLGYVSSDWLGLGLGLNSSPTPAPTLDGRPLLDPAHFALLSWDARGGSPQGNSLLRPCYPWWNEKRQALPDYRRSVHRTAAPKPVVTVANAQDSVAVFDVNGVATGAYETLIGSVLRMLQSWDNDSALALPEGCTLAMVEPKSDGKMFENFNTYCDRQIVGAILQSARATMEAEHSSKADSMVAKEGTAPIFRFIGDWLGRWLGNILWRLNVANFGIEDAYLYTPEVQVGQTDDEDSAAKMNAYGFIGYAVHPSQFAAIDADLGLPERDTSNDPVNTDPNAPPGNTAAAEKAGKKSAKGPPSSAGDGANG